MNEEIKNIIDQIVIGYDPEQIILFGSYAAGAPKINSDIDLVVIKDTRERFIDRLKKMAQITSTWEALDVLVYTPSEWKKALAADHYFIKEIAKKGKIVYER